MYLAATPTGGRKWIKLLDQDVPPGTIQIGGDIVSVIDPKLPALDLNNLNKEYLVSNPEERDWWRLGAFNDYNQSRRFVLLVGMYRLTTAANSKWTPSNRSPSLHGNGCPQ